MAATVLLGVGGYQSYRGRIGRETDPRVRSRTEEGITPGQNPARVEARDGAEFARILALRQVR